MRFSLVTLVRSKAAWRKHHCPPTVRNIGNSRLDFRASNHHDLSFRNKCHPMCLLLGTRHVVDIYRHLVKVHTHQINDMNTLLRGPGNPGEGLAGDWAHGSGSCFSRFTFFLRCVDPHSGPGFLLPPHPARLWKPTLSPRVFYRPPVSKSWSKVAENADPWFLPQASLNFSICRGVWAGESWGLEV